MFGYILEIAIIVVILFFQFKFFIANKNKRKILGGIFPNDIDEKLLAEKDEEGIAQINVIDYDNAVLNNEIVKPINSYLKENKGATDYHIIKDLTDRSCDKIQEEVDSYNPIPLYLGLCGTMLGIIVGIVGLWLGGGLDSLLASSSQTITDTNAGSEGIQHLLGGVAIAMIASFAGVLMTIFGTRSTKSAVASNEEGRNKFLSWIQCNLLPQMSSDVVSTLGVFYKNLNGFNRIFSENSRELRSAFAQIQEAYRSQTEYTIELNKLDIDKAQLAFSALGTATQRINDLNVFLKDSSSYISKVMSLNDKLDEADKRTQAIEQMGTFFKDEIEQISARKSMLSESIGKIDIALEDALTGLQTSSKDHVGKIQEHLAKVYLDFQKAIEDQQALLTQKLAESSGFLAEFKRLESIESKLSKLDKLDGVVTAVNSLGARIDSLQNTIKSTGASLKGNVNSPVPIVMNGSSDKDVKVNVKMPIPSWLAYGTCAVLIVAGIFSIVFQILAQTGAN